MMLRLVPDTNKAKDAMKELGLMTKDGSNNFFDAEGNVKDFSDVVQLLHDSLDDLNPEQRSAALKELFGTDAYRAGAIFFKDAAAGIEEMNQAMKETTAAEVAAIRMDTFLGKLEELKSTLATLGIEVADDAMGDLTEVVKELTGWVRDLDPEMVALGLKAVGAAAGFGLMATTLFKVSKGLMLLSANPVGLAITGISLLVGAFVGLNGAMKENEQISFEAVRAKQKEVEATDQLIARYDLLQAKNRLSNDEMLKFLDIQAQLEQSASPEVIKKLKDEQGKLLEKSTLTNEEMQEFLGLNDKIIEKAPTTEQAISSQGEAYAFNTEEIRKMNAEKRESMLMEAEGVLLDGLFKLAEEQRNINKLVKERNELNTQMTTQKDKLIEKNDAIREQELKITEIENSSRDTKAGELALANNMLQVLEQERSNIKQKITQLGEEVATKNESLEKSRQTVQEIQKAKLEYEQIILAQVGLNGKKGQGLELLNTEITKLQTEKALLDDQLKSGAIGIGQYQQKQEELDKQIAKLQNAQGELEEINDLAGKTIYDKQINISTNPSIYDLNAFLSDPVNKHVNVITSGGGHVIPAFAKGTDFHKGGPALVGEEGPELVQQGNKLSLQSFGIMPDLQSGAKVFTADETNKILSAINRFPAYASGVGTSQGEANRIISGLNNRTENNGNMTKLINAIYSLASRPVSFKINGREVITAIGPDMNEQLHKFQVEAKRGDGYL